MGKTSTPVCELSLQNRQNLSSPQQHRCLEDFFVPGLTGGWFDGRIYIRLEDSFCRARLIFDF
jgi:hypothetical protein